MRAGGGGLERGQRGRGRRLQLHHSRTTPTLGHVGLALPAAHHHRLVMHHRRLRNQQRHDLLCFCWSSGSRLDAGDGGAGRGHVVDVRSVKV